MKISTKGRYGSRAIIDLAANSDGTQVSLNSIAERQNVSENYLEQVFSTLRKAGLVKSVKGAQGGYMLSRNPENITVGDVLRALEGNLSVVDDMPEDMGKQDSAEYCLAISVWSKINECINNAVDSITLEELVLQYKKVNTETSMMFYI